MLHTREYVMRFQCIPTGYSETGQVLGSRSRNAIRKKRAHYEIGYEGEKMFVFLFFFFFLTVRRADPATAFGRSGDLGIFQLLLYSDSQRPKAKLSRVIDHRVSSLKPEASYT